MNIFWYCILKWNYCLITNGNHHKYIHKLKMEERERVIYRNSVYLAKTKGKRK